MYLRPVILKPQNTDDFAGFLDILKGVGAGAVKTGAVVTSGGSSGGILGRILNGLNAVGTIGATYYQNVGKVNYAKYGATEAESGIYPPVANQTPSQTFEQIGPYLLGGAGLIALSMIMSKSK